jgi:replicative superfamily II helicase
MSDLYDFSRRLGSSFYDLAICLSIESRDYESWSKGTEPEKILEWLRIRNKLQELEPALKKINREDLVDLAQSLCKIPNNNVNISVEKNNQESKVEELDGTNCFISESSHEDLAVDLKNADLVPSSELNPDLQSQESMPPEETVEKVEEEEVNTPIEEMRETDDGQPTLFALWEIALKRSLDGGVDTKAESFLNRMYSQSKQAKSGLTEIQKKLWDTYQDTEIEMSKQAFHSNLNIVISAPTSSGKSTLAEIFLAIPSFRHTTRKCAIYIAPTRALTQAKYLELKNLFKEFEDEVGEIVLSTGEDIEKDWMIKLGQFSIACMVYEKANILFSKNPQLLKKLGCLVVDEMHMIEDLERGPILEIALTKALVNQSENDAVETTRIVAISTEEKPTPQLEEFLSIRKMGTRHPQKPQSFCADGREVSVEHFLVLSPSKQEDIAKGLYAKFPIIEFKGNEQRQLTQQDIDNIDHNLNNNKKDFISPGKVNQNNKGQFSNRLINLIIDLLYEQPKGYRILVFIPGRDEAADKARQLKDKLKKFHDNNDEKYGLLGDPIRHKEIANHFKEMLENAEDTRMKTVLKPCIELGIFIHHSDIERKIRTEIEKTCSFVNEDIPSQVIFATETLSYGVNLAVQDVILYGVKFKSKTRLGKSEDKLLSTSSYHNMIGRAGRKGKLINEKAHAYILLPQEDAPMDIVRNYYKTINPVESKLYVADDKEVQIRAEENAANDKRNRLTNNNPFGAANLSYPFARAILDALRHLNVRNNENNVVKNRTTQRELLSFLSKTLYEKSNEVGHQTEIERAEEYDLFRDAVKIILDDCSSARLELAKKEGEGDSCYYEITPLGESIVDTGTAISTVGELRKIVTSLKSLWLSASENSAQNMPIELYLLCVIAQEEVFLDYIGCTPECNNKIPSNKWTDDLIRTNSLSVNSRFKKYLIKLLNSKKESMNLPDEELTEFLKELRSKILNNWVPLKQIDPHYELGASDSILRLVSGVFAWIDGADYEDVYKLIEEVDDPPKNMKGKMNKLRQFTEILSYKILFLSIMIEKSSGSPSSSSIPINIDPEIEPERELRILASRLRFGCTSQAVPFFKPSRSNISRKVAKNLLNFHITPHSILAETIAKLKGKEELDISSEKLEQLKTDLENDACNSFESLATYLTVGITTGENNTNEEKRRRTAIKELVEKMKELFKSSVKNFAKTNESKISFDDELRNGLNFSQIDDTQSWPRYQVEFKIPPHNMGIEWLGEESQMDYEYSDPEPKPQYIDKHRIKIVGIHFKDNWACKINQNNSNFINFLNDHKETKHLAIVPLPWIPSNGALTNDMKDVLKSRIEDGKTTTFITPAAFAAMLVFLVRNFNNIESYAESFTNLLVREPKRTNLDFNVVTVQDVRGVMRNNQNGVPREIMEALLEHFEADGDLYRE